MFATLLSYAQPDFYEAHRVIRFDTLFEEGAYEIMAAFYSNVYDSNDQNVFRYYQYTDLRNPDRFQEYVSQAAAAALYDTGVTAQYGDQLLTLTTLQLPYGQRPICGGGQEAPLKARAPAPARLSPAAWAGLAGKGRCGPAACEPPKERQAKKPVFLSGRDG